MIVTYFHRNKAAGYSINKVIQTAIKYIQVKEEFYVPCRKASFVDIIQNMWFVFKNRNKKDINHITGDIHYCIISLIGCKSILTIHDTAIVDYNNQSRLQKLYHRWLWYRIPLKYATKVTCISESTKCLLSKYSSRNDIQVIYNAIDPSFKTVLKDQSIMPYKILVIGTNPNKNLERTIKALRGIHCKLTIVGTLSDKQRELLEECNIVFENKVNLTDNEVIEEYTKCDIVSFISLFEGFGMPIVEANKTGRPVITSTIPVLKEVAGKSAVFVDPTNEDDMHNGFVQLFTDACLRQRCVDEGLENVKRFSADKISQQYKDIYNSLK